VTFSPHDKLPVHQHPPTPTTVYVYVTDGGAIRFNRVTGDTVAGLHIVRKPVLAAAPICVMENPRWRAGSASLTERLRPTR
jgi:hypothetical protein